MKLQLKVTKTYEVIGSVPNYRVFNEEFRRSRTLYTKKFSSCVHCHTKFKENEVMNLVILQGLILKMLCCECYTELKKR